MFTYSLVIADKQVFRVFESMAAKNNNYSLKCNNIKKTKIEKIVSAFQIV